MIKDKEKIGIEGWVTLTVSQPVGERAEKMLEAIKNSRESDKKALLDAYNKEFGVRKYRFKNIIPTVGRTRLAEILASITTTVAEGRINYSALGTGTTAPANANTQLATETYRKLIASLSRNNNILYATAFYLATDTNGTFYEHGIFINGSGSANTGVLLSRVLLNAPTGISKSSTETLTIEHEITFS